MNSKPTMFRSPIKTLGRLLPAIALAWLLGKGGVIVQTSPAQTVTSGSENPTPGPCCSCIQMEILDVPASDDPSNPVPKFPFDENQQTTIKVKVNRVSSGDCTIGMDKPLTGYVFARLLGSSSTTKPEQTFTIPANATESNVLTFNFDWHDTQISGNRWEFVLVCDKSECQRQPFDLGSGCSSCDASGAGAVCPYNTTSGSFRVEIPTLKSKGGMSQGTLYFFTKDFSFPGRAGLRANVPSNYTVTKDGIGITQINTGSGLIEIADVAGEQAFTITHKDAVGATIRTGKIAFVTEGGVQRLRADSTFEGVTTRHEQTQPVLGTLVLEKGHLGSGGFQPLQRETLVKTTVSPGVKKERRITEERASATHAWSATSDIETTWEKQIYSWVQTKEVIDPTGAALTTTWTYYQPGESTGPGSATQGLGRVKQVVRYDGYEEFHTYGLNENTVTTPYAGNLAGKVTTTTWNPGTQSETVTTTVNGQMISKSVTSHTPTTETQTVYTSAGDTLTTVTTYPAGTNIDFGGKPLKVQHPDGTLTTYAYTRNAGGGFTTVTESGSSANGTTVAKGTRSTSTTNSRGTTILSKTEAIGYGSGSSILGCTAVTSIDNLGRALATAHFPASVTVTGEVASASSPAWTTSTEYSCCGVAKETDMHGIPTFYAYDALRHPIKTNRLGVTTETIRNGLTTETHRYAETISASLSPAFAGIAATLVSKSVTNLAGTLQEAWSPDPTSATSGTLVKSSSTVATYKPAAGLSTRTVSTVPGGATQTTDSFLDGKSAATYGDLSTAMQYAYSVNATGEVTSQSIVHGTNLRETTTSQSDWAGRSITTTKGTITQTQTYNSLGQIVKSTDADNVSTLYAYNSLGERITTAVDINGNGQIDFDGTDHITVSTNAPGTYNSAPVFTSTSAVYATNGSDTATTVSTSHRTPDGLQSWSLSLGVANPAHSISSIGTGGSWNETSTAPDGTKTISTYTGGRLTSTENHSSLASSSLLASVSYGYDSLGRPVTSTDSRTGVTTTAYVSVTCDAVLSTTDPGNRVTSYGYDSQGRRLTTTLPDNSVTHTSYYPDGQVKATWGSQTYPTFTTYDYAGRQLTLRTQPTLASGIPTNAGGSVTTWNYSSTTGQLLSKLDDAGKGAIYSYTPAGRLATRTWARTVNGAPLTTAYGYSAGQLTTTDYSDATPDVTITHNRLGQPLTITQANQSRITNTYDPATLAADTETISYDLDHDGSYDFTRVLDRSQDTLGRSTGFQLKDGTTLENQAAYAYSSTDGRLQSISGGGSQAPSPANTFTYNYLPNSNLIEKISGPIHDVNNAWETNRNVLASKQNKVGTTAISQYDYTVNVLGQRTNLATSGTAFANAPSWLWGYDSLGQVISADSNVNTSDRAYQYDTIGNRLKSADSLTLPTSNNYTPNTLNQYTATPYGSASVPPEYDFDGNMTAGPLPAAPSSNSALAWDGENRLISTTVNGITTIYLYDAQARRIAMTTGGNTTLYVYDGFNCIAEYSGTTLSKTRLWGIDLSGSLQGAGGVGGLLAEKQGSNFYCPLFDGNGNVSEYIDSAGSIAAHFEYDPFGNTVVNTDSGNIFYYRFSTKPLDFATGLYYYQYRWYDPLTGRWPSRDPIEENGGLNLYGFVENSGISNTDILGLLIMLIRSEYADGKGNPIDRDKIWTIINKPISVEIDGHYYQFPAPLRHIELANPDVGGQTKQDAIPNVQANKCFVSGDIYHFVMSLTMNTNPRRSKIFYDYWATALHEVMHIQALVRRIQAISERVKPWEDQFDNELDAKIMASFYKGLIAGMVRDAKEQERNHNTSDGFGTPDAHTVYPGWNGP